jgi:hypothetical protein
MRGILLIAIGHHYYMRMAVNLAVSLKSTSDIPITIVHGDGSIKALYEHERKLFDNIVEAPKEYYHTKCIIKEHIKIKTHLYNLTPYDETIYLDVDMVWGKFNINDLFKELSDANFTIQSRGYCDMAELNPDYSWWVNLQELSDAYGIKEGRYYSYSSEFIYFKKCKEVKDYFKRAVKNYETLKVKHTRFAGGIPDELVFSLTTLQTGLEPHKSFFTPIYWEQAEKRSANIAHVTENYYAYSIGGSALSSKEKLIYDNLVLYHANKTGFTHLFKAKSKREFIPLRQSL